MSDTCPKELLMSQSQTALCIPAPWSPRDVFHACSTGWRGCSQCAHSRSKTGSNWPQHMLLWSPHSVHRCWDRVITCSYSFCLKGIAGHSSQILLAPWNTWMILKSNPMDMQSYCKEEKDALVVITQQCFHQVKFNSSFEIQIKCHLHWEIFHDISRIKSLMFIPSHAHFVPCFLGICERSYYKNILPCLRPVIHWQFLLHIFLPSV